MTYIYQYDVAAIVILILIMILYFANHSYPTLTNKFYITIVFCAMISSISDLMSAYTLTHSDTFPLKLNYVINILYLLSYSFCAVFYYIYVLVLTKRKHITSFNRMLYIVISIITLFLILTTPFTKWIIYFDENRTYQHGPLFMLLSVNAIFLLFYIMGLFFKYKEKLSFDQSISIGFCNTATIFGVIFQVFYPRQLICNFMSALFLILSYISLENPENYLDKNAQCLNKNAFYEDLEHMMGKNIPFTLIAINLEGFQYIYQTLGAQWGNQLIAQASAYLSAHFPKRNIYHLGDCQFVLRLEDKQVSSRDCAQSLQKYFEIPFWLDQLEVSVTPYICILHYPDFAKTPEDILDTIKYSFKEIIEGMEDTIMEASRTSLDAKRRENKIIHILKEAIRNQQFQVWYQPIYDTQHQKFHSAEALIRLWDEELGYIPPDEFIPIAEQNGLIIEIGEMIFENVCQFIKKHPLESLGSQFIEVNLSTIQCMQENLAQQLIGMMQKYNLSPSHINFEITETANKMNETTLRKNMQELIKAGTSFSMDDYGTGFSTANYLISLPMKIIKIDKSILWPAMQDREAFIILRHTVQMLRALHKEIVVEGVETEEMAEILTQMGCDYLQGYLFSKPLPADAYVAFLEKNNHL